MADIAVLGLGAMGSRMAAALLRAGHKVTAWNRTATAAGPVVDAGAVLAATPRAAVAGAQFAIAMVRDDAASRRVWLDPVDGALEALAPDAVLIESSTLSMEWIRELAGRAAARHIAMLDAPVAGSRPQAEAGQLIYLVGGEAETLERVRPILLAMAAAIHHAGPIGSGAVVKLVVNTLFAVQVVAMGELLGFLRRSDISPRGAVEILGATPVCSPAAKGAAVSMLANAFAPMFPVELVEKDIGYFLSAAAQLRSQTPLAHAAHAAMQRALAAGFGDENLTAVARTYL